MDDPLTRFLDRLERPEIEVPDAVDRRILGHARWVLLRRRMMPVLAVAAVLLVAVTFGWQRYGGSRESSMRQIRPSPRIAIRKPVLR